MSEENKALARRYLEEVWDMGNVDLIDELFTTDFVRHGPPAVEGEVRGPGGFKGLERVMNLGENRIEMRIPRSPWFPCDLRFPHS